MAGKVSKRAEARKQKRKLIFVTGGARSGKSSFALQKAMGIQGKRAYIATAEALDEEMIKRIERHRKDRKGEWDTYEEPLRIAKVIKEIKDKYNVIIIDCLTLWLANLMHAGQNIESRIDNFISTVGAGLALPDNEEKPKKGGPRPAPTIFIVSNEVGMGIVPENEMARKFRDWAGILNQRIAHIADEVYMAVSGIPVRIK